MGLLSLLFGRKRLSPGRAGGDSLLTPRKLASGFEPIEPRRLMTADPIRVGAVYVEQDTGSDVTPDRFEISFVGGAPGTMLRRLVISGDQDGNGFDEDDVFFDTITNPSSLGALTAFPPVFHADLSDDVGDVTFTAVDGSTDWVLNFSDFDAGERVVLTIDVDEAEFYDPTETDWNTINSGFDTITSGIEFQGSILSATFTAPHYHEISGSGPFWNEYDDEFAGSGLDLPSDGHSGFVNRTTGGIATMQQQPLPITIAGTVFKDPNLNNRQDTGEIGLAGVQVSLWRLEGSTYVSTGQTRATDAQGAYRFEGSFLIPGTYRVVQTQPANPYFSVGASAGRVSGAARGTVESTDVITGIVLNGGENSVGNDFAEALPGSLSGFVYIDANDNGTRDSGEAGIGGVTIQLLDAAGNATGRTATTSTDPATLGYYIFSDVRPGAWGVAEVQPAAYDDGKDQAGSAGGTVLAQPGDRITGAALASEMNAVNYNFGELIPPGSISGFVHSDPDLDCVFDSSEAPLSGVVVELLNSQGQLIRTATTDSAGRYEFDDLAPGVYAVRQRQPSGFFHGGQSLGSGGGVVLGDDHLGGIQVQSRVELVNYNFCEIPPASLSGHVFIDANDNGVRDGGEAGIGGVTLRLLDGAGNPTGQTIVTSSDPGNLGFYRFDNLRPGTYGVREDHPAAYDDGKEQVGSAGGTALAQPGDQITGALIQAGIGAVNYNFGELIPPGSISGFVHSDPDQDCVFDSSEAPIAGVTIELLSAQNQVVRTTTTDTNGRYHFDNVPPGIYAVRQAAQPAGFFHGGQVVGSGTGTIAGDDHISGIQIQSRVHLVNYNFCEIPPAQISGFVYIDANNNGLRDAGEQGIGAVTIRLSDENGNPVGAPVTTSNDPANLGFYRFSGLRPGKYTLREDQPAAYDDGLDQVGDAGGAADPPPGDRLAGAMLRPGQIATNYNFGERIPPGSLAGRVFSDPDGDCFFDQGETPLSGVTIELLDAQGQIVRTTTTDNNGRYEFAGLAPGIYAVRERQPSGFFHGGQTIGAGGGTILADDHVGGINVAPRVAHTDYNFCETPPASISGLVYFDPNNNGLRDSGEVGIGGVTIELLDASGNPTGATTTTSAVAATLGQYAFTNLRPGTYGVREVQPAGYRDGRDSPGSAGGTALPPPGDRITGANLTAGIAAINYNFAERPLPGVIRGLVHSDPDQDCVFDTGETPIAGVLVELVDSATGQIVRAVRTSASGEYTFTDVEPGTYTIREHQPSGYFHGGQVAGSAGGITSESQPDQIRGVVLPAGQTLTGYNFCEIPPGLISGIVFQDGAPIRTLTGRLEQSPDAIKDGRLTPDDKRLAGVTLRLTHGISGEPIYGRDALPGLYAPDQPITVRTDASGFYQFSGLAPGNYGVFEVHPEPYLDSRDTAGTRGGRSLNPSDPIPSIIIEQLAVPHNYDAILRIQLPAGTVSTNNNFSEVLITRVIPPLAEPPAPIETPLPTTVYIPPPPIPQLISPLIPLSPRDRLQAGRVGGFTWHLSVIDAGYPRGTTSDGETSVFQSISNPQDEEFHARQLDEAVWTLESPSSKPNDPPRRIAFGLKKAIPVVGDFNGDGVSELALWDRGQWFIDLNGNGQWDADDLWAKLGTAEDRPIVGDWNGDGKDDIGIFGPAWSGDPHAVAKEPGLPHPLNSNHGPLKNLPPGPEDATHGTRKLRRAAAGNVRSDVIDHVFHFGTATDLPVVGDWRGSGIATIAIFRDGAWRLDIDGDGRWSAGDLAIDYGQAGDKPVVGDWNADGIADLGVYRDGTFILDSDANRRLDATDKRIQLGGPGAHPVAGDWDGDGADEVGIYEPQ